MSSEYMTIEQLVAKFNNLAQSSNIIDKRVSNELSVRRVRDYVSKGVLDKPIKDGRNALFTEAHLNKLLAIRELQSEGLSDQFLKKLNNTAYQTGDVSSVGVVNQSLRQDAFSVLSEIRTNNAILPSAGLLNSTTPQVLRSHYSSNDMTGKKMAAVDMLTTQSVPRQKKINEYDITPNGEITLHIEDGFRNFDRGRVLGVLKGIINSL